MKKEEIIKKLDNFKNEKGKEIENALKALEKFWQKFPFRKDPEEIDKLTLDKIYKKGGKEDTFLYWIEYGLEDLGEIGVPLRHFAENLDDFKKKIHIFKKALKEALNDSIPLSQKIDLKEWGEIKGFGKEKYAQRVVVKKIIFCYYPDEIVPIFNTKHAEEVAKKFGINYEEKAKEKYNNKTYKDLSEGEKFELFNELFMEYKKEVLNLEPNRFNNVLFARFIYEDEELKPKQGEKTKENNDQDLEETPEKLTESQSEISPLHQILNALQTKPFLILAGISGTGKTQIARLAAWAMSEGSEKEIKEYIDENTLILKEDFFEEPPVSSPEKVAFLPVKPDWNEPVKMWGFYNPLTGLFYPTDGLKVLLNAFRDYVLNKDENKKYFIILDEMNLARVEHYMSDLLSLMENMCKKQNGKIIIGETAMIHQLSRCVLSKLPEKEEENWKKYIKKENGEIKWKIEGEKLCMEECDNCPYKALKENKKEQSPINEMEEFIKNFSPIPPRIAYPPNLVIIGTVNVDETTFSFAPKVLDRAWVKNLDEVHVEEYLSTCTDLGDKKNDNVFFKFVDTLIKILQPANLHFGYRVIHEMLKYLCAAKIITKEEKKFKISELTESGDFNFHLDFLLNSKVLPKIHGGEEKVEEILRKLLVYCYRDDYENGAQNLEKEKEPWWRKKLEEIKEIIQKYDKKAAPETGTQPSTEDKQKKETSPQESEVSSPKNTCKFPKSAQKILEMYRRLKDTGYCSYF